ncbi:uncharacterized protein LOC135487990 [Lineus longissimus]|uniref:uncharacterized protein LOC135487990 n=1 Tax=Lineus longissimus TaxID=88925 RepID=UPI00315D717F
MEYGQSRLSPMDTLETQTNNMSISDRRRNPLHWTRIRTVLMELGISLLAGTGSSTQHWQQACCMPCGLVVKVWSDLEEEDMIEQVLAEHDRQNPECHEPRQRHKASKPSSNRGIGIFRNSNQDDLICDTDALHLDDEVVTDCAMYSPPTMTPKTQSGKQLPKSSHMGYHPSNALHPVFANRIQRLESMRIGAKLTGYSLEEAAEAGFVHLPHQNRSEVMCFYCGVKVNLLRHNDAWIEHAQANPFCDFIKREKGDSFINLVVDIRDVESAPAEFALQTSAQKRSPFTPAPQQTTQQVPNEQPAHFAQSQPPRRQQIRDVDKREIQARLDRDECQLIIGMGFSRELVGQVIGEQLMYNGDDFKSFMDMFKVVEEAAQALNMN